MWMSDSKAKRSGSVAGASAARAACDRGRSDHAAARASAHAEEPAAGQARVAGAAGGGAG